VVALVVLGWAVWYFGMELPDRSAMAALAKQRAANARTIPDLKLDLVWIARGDFMIGRREPFVLTRWFYAAREKLTKESNPWDWLGLEHFRFR